MNKNSNTYIIIYATVLVVVVAALLSFAATSLKPMQQANVRVEKMSAILSSIGEGKEADSAESKDTYIEEQYSKYIVSAFCVDAQGNKVEGANAFSLMDNLAEVFTLKQAMPVFQAKLSDGMTLYVVPTSGKGLWGPIWGYVALKDDCSTIFGAVFDHKGETPGLGAELALPAFSNQFIGKELYKGSVFESISLTKGSGSSEGNPYAVDAISGGTLTSNGISAMLKSSLGAYVPFFDKVRSANSRVSSDVTSLTDSLAVVDTVAIAVVVDTVAVVAVVDTVQVEKL